MALPTLGLNIEHLTNNPPHSIDGCKRRIPADAPEVKAKRQFVGNSYDEIVALAIRAFGPQMYLCQSTEPKSFEYEFFGRNRMREQGNMKLLFTLQLDPTTMKTQRVYNLTFHIADEYGEIDASSLMMAHWVSQIHQIPCALSAPQIRKEIEKAIHTWLDVASLYYIPVYF